jgi:hypothetical protein
MPVPYAVLAVTYASIPHPSGTQSLSPCASPFNGTLASHTVVCRENELLARLKEVKVVDITLNIR